MAESERTPRLRVLAPAAGDARRARPHPLLSAAQLERIYESFLQPVYRFIFARVGNREDAEDLTSQVFVRSLDYLDPTAATPAIEAYLYRIARGHIADHWRRWYALPVEPLGDEAEARADDDEGADDQPSSLEALVGELERILGLLPPNYRRVLELRFYEGRSIKETARSMQVSEANAKVLQYRAIRRAAALARGEGES